MKTPRDLKYLWVHFALSISLFPLVGRAGIILQVDIDPSQISANGSSMLIPLPDFTSDGIMTMLQLQFTENEFIRAVAPGDNDPGSSGIFANRVNFSLNGDSDPSFVGLVTGTGGAGFFADPNGNAVADGSFSFDFTVEGDGDFSEIEVDGGVVKSVVAGVLPEFELGFYGLKLTAPAPFPVGMYSNLTLEITADAFGADVSNLGTISVQVVPEPSSAFTFLMVVGLACCWRKRSVTT